MHVAGRAPGGGGPRRRANDLRIRAAGGAEFSPRADAEAPLPGPGSGPPLARMASMSWIELVVILAVWLLLQAFVLPRLGVPT